MSFLAVLFFLSLGALASSPSSSRSIHSLKTASEGYRLLERAAAEATISFDIVLPPKDASALYTTLHAVSDPTSKSYGQYLSAPEAAALVAPADEHKDAVAAWLAEAGSGLTVEWNLGSDVATVETTVGKAEELFSPAEFSVFAGKTGKLVRALSYGMPKQLEDAVEFILGLDDWVEPDLPGPLVEQTADNVQGTSAHERRAHGHHFGGHHRHLHRRASGTAAHPPKPCVESFDVNCAREEYGLGNRTVQPRPENTFVVYSYAAQAPRSDYRQFLERYVPEYADHKLEIISIDGGADYDLPDAAVEAALDVDTMMGMTLPATTSIAIVPPTEGFIKSMFRMSKVFLNETHPPSVVSISYATREIGILKHEKQVAAARKLCDTFAQLGVRGTTVLSSSGDGGPGRVCHDGPYHSLFPTTCPAVVSVGATAHIPEKSTMWSGAGFSSIFPRPAFQEAVVPPYLEYLAANDQLKPDKFNASGRAYADLTAYGKNFPIVWNGTWHHAGGTSASTPLFGAIVGHLNDVQLAAGKPTLGWMLPWVYTVAGPGGAFKDLTAKCAWGCGKECAFNATTSWDVVTGWGTPIFDKLVALLP